MRLLVALCALLALAALAGEIKLGQPLSARKQLTVAKLLEKVEKKLGKTVQVKGTIRAVCQHMGCWMELADTTDGEGIRIKVEDGVIVFPKDGIGKTAIAEGTLAKVAADKHEHGGGTYQVLGTGAVILE